MNLLEEAKQIAQDIINIRRDIHMHPELGRHEYRTAEVITARLESLGLEPRRVADTGVCVDIVGAYPGKTVAIRADIDALPIQELTGLPFCSQNEGVMHACGHDVHTSALLGAAQLLCAHRDTMHGRVRLFFQPDEEYDGGAQRMIDEGCMEGVDAVFGAHVAPELPAGTVGFRSGKHYAASNPFDITIRGRASHGAEPHLGIDAIVCASAVVSALQTIASRSLSPLEPALITVGSFHAGTARNIIADTAELKGILRCFGHDMRVEFSNRIEKLVKGLAASMNCEADVRIIWSYSGIINDEKATEFAAHSAEKIVGKDHVVFESVPTLTSEDFGAFLEHSPGSFWHIGVGRSIDNHPVHNPRFNPDESAIPIASAIHAQIAWDYLHA